MKCFEITPHMYKVDGILNFIRLRKTADNKTDLLAKDNETNCSHHFKNFQGKRIKSEGWFGFLSLFSDEVCSSRGQIKLLNSTFSRKATVACLSILYQQISYAGVAPYTKVLELDSAKGSAADLWELVDFEWIIESKQTHRKCNWKHL